MLQWGFITDKVKEGRHQGGGTTSPTTDEEGHLSYRRASRGARTAPKKTAAHHPRASENDPYNFSAPRHTTVLSSTISSLGTDPKRRC
jgi:hypothetical protein